MTSASVSIGVSENVTLFIDEDDDIDAMAIERAMKKLKLNNKLIRAVDRIDALDQMRGINGQKKIQKPFLT